LDLDEGWKERPIVKQDVAERWIREVRDQDKVADLSGLTVEQVRGLMLN
jgi:hypothetical protein